MESITIFEKIMAGEVPAEIIFENEHVIAFNDINPQAPIHVLVVPKKKIVSIAGAMDISAEDMGYFMQGVCLTARALQLDENGYRVVINHGRDGQQTVAYIHAHILGGKKLSWPPC